MTEQEKKYNDKYQNMPTGQIIKNIFILLGKLIVACLKYALKKFLKGIIWCIEKLGDGYLAIKDFWFSDNTQEKKRKVVAWIKQSANSTKKWLGKAGAWIKKYTVIGAKQTWKYTCIGCRLFIKYFIITIIGIYHGILWTLRTIKDLIIHSKPTFIRLGKSIKQGSIDFWHWLIRAGRGIKLGHIRRRRAWNEFRRTTSFKGLLISMAHGFSNGIKNFMDEEQNETHPEAITEDDIIAEQMEDRQSKANEIGKKFFQSVKDIVEEKD